MRHTSKKPRNPSIYAGFRGVTNGTALFTSIEEIENRNEMNVHFISIDL